MNGIGKLRNMIRYGVKKLTTRFTNYPIAQFKWLGKSGDVMVFYPYGTSGNAPLGSVGVILNILGDESNRAAMEFDRASLPGQLLPNEFECGNFVIGSTIKFDAAGNITVTSVGNVTINAAQSVIVNAVADITATCVNLNATATGAATITAPTTTINGNLIVTGTLNVSGISTLAATTMTAALIGGINFATHVHGGVSSGGNTTAVPQ